MKVKKLAVTAAVFALFLALCNSHEGHGPNVDHKHATNAEEWRDPEYRRDVEHIKEHYEGVVDIDTNNMTEEEMEFHFFYQHDTDKNLKLDGLEILASLLELMSFQFKQMTKKEVEKKIQETAESIDQVLEADDVDNDGYLTYPEYVSARRRPPPPDKS
ncbi:multiple coagulation factor deficiency protein 2 homolog [Lingula anatina]|uniref:Multiple coagulation factor deficiency protein 2 homolog n=1 Tax=Lingula anatina TaxID=7574 RepID=A0A1S3H032_LINAN|nr:multiple coagulation factor deficiency protein 2 homolog [Lingula anatina]XP_013379288.1 multiple coagulation factor deficiency protein 2 homolog [Lingula anatina]|eukprot:XP_013379287.1 multiple coagulation factor deficiency protein 2 homolog [Lingula anatina]